MTAVIRISCWVHEGQTRTLVQGGTATASETEQELRRYLEGVHFAANKEDLISIAMSNDAPEELIGQLEDLPRKEFSDLEEVAEAIDDLRPA
jgi:uncharacterized protein DUF2795